VFGVLGVFGWVFVMPEDIQAVFASVCQHRLGLHNESGEAQVNDILKNVLVPV